MGYSISKKEYYKFKDVEKTLKSSRTGKKKKTKKLKKLRKTNKHLR